MKSGIREQNKALAVIQKTLKIGKSAAVSSLRKLTPESKIVLIILGLIEFTVMVEKDLYP
jgi:hypothetical protein